MESRRIISFQAVGLVGNIYNIVVYTDIQRCGDTSDPAGEVDGRRSYRTMTGLTVNCLGMGRYEILETGEELTSDDPNAP